MRSPTEVIWCDNEQNKMQQHKGVDNGVHCRPTSLHTNAHSRTTEVWMKIYSQYLHIIVHMNYLLVNSMCLLTFDIVSPIEQHKCNGGALSIIRFWNGILCETDRFDDGKKNMTRIWSVTITVCWFLHTGWIQFASAATATVLTMWLLFTLNKYLRMQTHRIARFFIIIWFVWCRFRFNS